MEAKKTFDLRNNIMSCKISFPIVYNVVWMTTMYLKSVTAIENANKTYHKTSNISRTLVCNKIVDHSDVVGALPVGAAPTTSSYFT